MESQLHNLRVEALTVDTVPVIQSSRLEDYSPEMWALTGSKGAVVAQMLRYVVGDEAFFKTLKNFAQQNAWKSVNTDDLRQVVDAVTGNKTGLFLHPMDRIFRSARIQAGLHRLPPGQRSPRRRGSA